MCALKHCHQFVWNESPVANVGWGKAKCYISDGTLTCIFHTNEVAVAVL